MPDTAAIADVSATLQAVLTDAFSSMLPAPPPVAEIHNLEGAISTTPARMTIFLFEAIEDPTVRNRPPTRSTSGSSIATPRSPVPLILKYMLTPWSPDRRTEQLMLGRALRVMHDGAILSGPQLQGGLAGSSEAIKLKLAPLTLEEQTRVWYAVQKPYRLSLTYHARVINIDSQTVHLHAPIRSRALDKSVGDGQP
jgi:hypothetical protein